MEFRGVVECWRWRETRRSGLLGIEAWLLFERQRVWTLRAVPVEGKFCELAGEAAEVGMQELEMLCMHFVEIRGECVHTNQQLADL